MKSNLFLFLVLLLIVPVTSFAKNENYQIDPSLSEVKFTTKPPLRVVGETSQIEGEVTGDLLMPHSLKAHFTVQLDSLKTGNKRRDKEMREKCFETEKYPEAYFKMSQIKSNGAIHLKEKSHIEIEGEFDLHGVKKKERFFVDVVEEKGLLVVDSEFQILLSDYQIVRPRKLIFQIADPVTIHLHLVFVSKK